MINNAKKPEGGKVGQRKNTAKQIKIQIKKNKKDANLSSLTHLKSHFGWKG